MRPIFVTILLLICQGSSILSVENLMYSQDYASLERNAREFTSNVQRSIANLTGINSPVEFSFFQQINATKYLQSSTSTCFSSCRASVNSFIVQESAVGARLSEYLGRLSQLYYVDSMLIYILSQATSLME